MAHGRLDSILVLHAPPSRTRDKKRNIRDIEYIDFLDAPRSLLAPGYGNPTLVIFGLYKYTAIYPKIHDT